MKKTETFRKDGIRTISSEAILVALSGAVVEGVLLCYNAVLNVSREG